MDCVGKVWFFPSTELFRSFIQDNQASPVDSSIINTHRLHQDHQTLVAAHYETLTLKKDTN